MKHRWFGDLAVSLVMAALGGVTMFLMAEALDIFIRMNAPEFYRGFYPWDPKDKNWTLGDSQKDGWGDLVSDAFLWGFSSHGLANFALRLARLGTHLTHLKAYLLVAAGGLLGTVVGGGFGFLLGAVCPESFCRAFPAGGEPWFHPVDVGIGLGIHRGIVIGLIIGGLTVVLRIFQQLKHRRREQCRRGA